MFKEYLSKGESGFEISIFSYILLTLSGGFLDAYTYIMRGGVFANAQTGNLVLTGISIAKGEVAVVYILPVLSFVVGILVSHFIKDRIKNKNIWLSVVLAAEIAALAVIGFIPAEPEYKNPVNISISFITAIQYGAFRKLGDLPFATTMCTGMLRSGTDHLHRFIRGKDSGELIRAASYYAIVFVFVIGAMIGGVICSTLGERSVWVCAGLFAAVLGENLRKH